VDKPPTPGRIVTLKRGLDDLFRTDPDILVAANLTWYPLEGDNGSKLLPALMVVFGRSKGPRDAYRQWQEGGVTPQVNFEILPLDDRVERRLRRYERFGVEEYYVFDARSDAMTGWVSTCAGMDLVHRMARWLSPPIQCPGRPGDRRTPHRAASGRIAILR
jgi:Uma2 family endonuclease